MAVGSTRSSLGLGESGITLVGIELGLQRLDWAKSIGGVSFSGSDSEPELDIEVDVDLLGSAATFLISSAPAAN